MENSYNHAIVSLQKEEPFQAEVGMQHILICILCRNHVIHFADKRDDSDDDSGMDPSTFTDTKSTEVSCPTNEES